MKAQRRRWSVSTVLLWSFYAAIAIATFRHSAWGFATLETTFLATSLLAAEGILFWLTGGIAALAIDAGMAGIVQAIREGKRSRWVLAALLGVMFASAFTQLIYAVTHAVPTSAVAFNVAPWLLPTATFVWESRVLILPLLLPSLALVYAAVAMMEERREELVYKDDGRSMAEILAEDERLSKPFVEGLGRALGEAELRRVEHDIFAKPKPVKPFRAFEKAPKPFETPEPARPPLVRPQRSEAELPVDLVGRSIGPSGVRE